jgi:hypothetical protein
MSDEQRADEAASSDSGMTVISIPSDKVDAVLEFLKRLDDVEGDVSGHMLGGGLAAKMSTMTGAAQTGGPAFFQADYSSRDSDLT